MVKEVRSPHSLTRDQPHAQRGVSPALIAALPILVLTVTGPDMSANLHHSPCQRASDELRLVRLMSDGFRAAHLWPALQEPFAIASLTRRLTSARRPTDSCQP